MKLTREYWYNRLENKYPNNRYIQRYIKLIRSISQSNRSLTKENTHKHHIFPRSWGGTNDSSNLIILTFREHIIAHHLLYYTDDPKMIIAFYSMANIGSKSEIKYNLTTQQYQRLCEQVRPIQSEIQKRKMDDPKVRQKISNSLKGKYTGSKSGHHCAVINLNTKQVYDTAREADKVNGYRLGSVTYGITTRHLVRGEQWEYYHVYLQGDVQPIVREQPSRFKGKKHSEETKRKISESLKGREAHNRQKVINLQTMEVFDSCADACSVLGYNRTTMSSSLYKAKSKGDNVFRCGGYDWTMYDEYVRTTKQK